MGLIEDFNKSVATRIDDAGEAGFKMVPITVTAIANDGTCTVKIQGSTSTYAAVVMTGQRVYVGDTGYALWHPG